MALEWRAAVERMDVYLKELLSSGLLLLHAELGVDVGLKAELLPPGLLACVAAGLGLLLALLLWWSVCRCFSKKTAERVAPEAGKISRPKAEEVKKRSRKRGGEKKVQRNGQAVDLEEELKPAEIQNPSESPDPTGGKSEKGKKNKKKTKAQPHQHPRDHTTSAQKTPRVTSTSSNITITKNSNITTTNTSQTPRAQTSPTSKTPRAQTSTPPPSFTTPRAKLSTPKTPSSPHQPQNSANNRAHQTLQPQTSHIAQNISIQPQTPEAQKRYTQNTKITPHTHQRTPRAQTSPTPNSKAASKLIKHPNTQHPQTNTTQKLKHSPTPRPNTTTKQSHPTTCSIPCQPPTTKRSHLTPPKHQTPTSQTPKHRSKISTTKNQRAKHLQHSTNQTSVSTTPQNTKSANISNPQNTKSSSTPAPKAQKNGVRTPQLVAPVEHRSVSADQASDYCAPCEEWGNYEDPAGGTVPPVEPQDSDLEKDDDELAGPGSSKAKRKKKKKKKGEDTREKPEENLEPQKPVKKKKARRET
ncbi:hypothetical protein Baya_16634 [Bagarius yarrelli]|uniref:Protein LYRIC n=1 Tax=Bagarius yarrelli TaxID=175774 RepID=A0A556VW23_BAGYA|nr:hypothetical protein Baya_16634 [Bagarius yarrelli]